MWDRFYLHFADEESKAQRNDMICPIMQLLSGYHWTENQACGTQMKPIYYYHATPFLYSVRFTLRSYRGYLSLSIFVQRFTVGWMVLRVRRLQAGDQTDTSSQRLALMNDFNLFLCLEGRHRVLKLPASSPGSSHLSFLSCPITWGPQGRVPGSSERNLLCLHSSELCLWVLEGM